MRISRTILSFALVLSVTTLCPAERVLDRDETLEILKELTSRNRTTWISAGVIEGTHEAYRAPITTDEETIERQIQQEIEGFEANPDKRLRSEKVQKLYLEAIPFNVRYRLANESMTLSNEVVKYDGQRFYWEIDIASRSDSVDPTADLIDNYMTEDFDLTWNERRIYAWDGSNYTIYSPSGKYATVDADDRFPRHVNGPLKAGIIGWGRGNLSYDNLSEAEISATEVDRDGISQIQLLVSESDGTTDEFYLVPAMDYAATSCTLEWSDGTITTVYYDGYEEYADSWVPSSILTEKYDALSEELLRSDKWDITVVDSSVPESNAFKVPYYDNTAVEYCSAGQEKMSLYYYSKAADIDAIRAAHLAYVSNNGKRKQNCATAALKYAATRLGISASDDKLATLVNPRGQTSLYDLKQCAENLGLHCQRLDKTDLSTLADLSDCQMLVAQPGQEHLAVIDRIDDSEQAWIVDLTNRNFYYRRDAGSIAKESTVMLLSRKPVVAQAQSDDEVSSTTMVGETAYSCTDLIQEEAYVTCNPDCTGIFYWFYERWGCELASSGSCVSEVMARSASVQCDLKLNGLCQPLGDWYYAPMYACL